MTNTTVANAAADADVHPSQIIEHRDTSEIPRAGTLPEGDVPKEPAKPLSTRDAIAKAFDEASKASEADKAAVAKQDDAKGKTEQAQPASAEPKADKTRDEAGKFAKAEQAQEQPAAKVDQGAPQKGAVQEAPERRQSEGRHPEPPARFLPEARAKWANVPNEVKGEIHRIEQEREAETQQFRASHERYSQLKEFDDLARSNGRDLRESLLKVNEVESALQRNVVDGLDAVLREIGPLKSDGSRINIMDVAQFLTQNPQVYRPQMATAPQTAAAPQAQQQAANPEIEALKAQVSALQANSVTPVVQAFAAGKSDFDALSPAIEAILKDGIVERLFGTGLSLEQKLSEAYRMAGGQGPSSRPDTETAAAHSEATPAARPVDPDGQKSIKGAPTAGQTGEPQWRPKSNREAVERAFANVR